MLSSYSNPNPVRKVGQKIETGRSQNTNLPPGFYVTLSVRFPNILAKFIKASRDKVFSFAYV